MFRRKTKSTTWFGRHKKASKPETSKIINDEQEEQANSLIDNVENEEQNFEDNESSTDDEITSERPSKLQELRNWIQSKVSYENIKAWFRWLLDYAFFEIRVSVSSLFICELYF